MLGYIQFIPPPSLDKSGATDSTAIQMAIDASPRGSTLLFSPGTYHINKPIVFLSDREYVGSGAALGNGTLIQQADSANITNSKGGLTGLMVASSWATNSKTCDGPVIIKNIAFDGNMANNSSSNAGGVVICNYWTHVIGCYFYNIPLHAITLTDVTASGTNVVINSASENRIIWNKIVNVGGDGIHQVCANHISNQDGYCIDNVISAVRGNGMHFERGSGWVFRRNHLYVIGGHGMYLNNTFATVVMECEIEDFGNQANAGEIYHGVYIGQLNGRGTIVTNNYVGCLEPSTKPAAYHYITAVSIHPGAPQLNANVIIALNHIRATHFGHTKLGTAVVLQVVLNSILKVTLGQNHVNNINSPLYVGHRVELYASSGEYVATSGHAPQSVTRYSCNSSALQAVASGEATTGGFSVPYSGSVVVTVDLVARVDKAGATMWFALAEHGTVAPVLGHVQAFNDAAAGCDRPYSMRFLVTGLSPGSRHTFDLLYGVTSGAELTVVAVGQSTTTPPASIGGAPILMTVQAV